MAAKIKQIVLADGSTYLDATALQYIGMSSKNNVEISSPKNINLESTKNIKLKPGDGGGSGNGGQLELVADNTGDLDEVVFKAVTSVSPEGTELEDDKIIRLKLNISELELNTKDSTDPTSCDIKFRTGKSSNKKYIEAKLKAKSVDLRAYAAESKAGSGGGIAVQIASCDSAYHENKFKIETSRKVDVSFGLPTQSSEWSNFYVNEGGKGIEIGTINSQFESIFTNTMRRGKMTKVYAAQRTDVSLQGDKYDYITQTDDSKDILTAQPYTIYWVDILNAAAYLKSHGAIPSDGSYYDSSTDNSSIAFYDASTQTLII